ncbi:MAG TPA: hypothetical protein VF179_25820 [Thermoanaerobaculia bacterium]|nr:hypothetical protein [Thermoanaerobaculia bacterium]
MSRVPLYMHRVSGWEVTNTGLAANKGQVQHLEGHRAELEQKTARFKELSAQHSALTTSKQEVGKEMRSLFREIETLVAFLRVGVRQHFGKDSEKMIEFGLQPFRGRTETPKPTLPEAPAPSDPTSAS